MVFGGQILYDSYDRKARLAPALLAVVPLLAAALFSFENATLIGRLASLLVAVGGLWLLVDMSRGLGRAKQQQLFAKWGGTPSIQLLRHTDRTIAHTKARYHACLKTKAKVQPPRRRKRRQTRKVRMPSMIRRFNGCYRTRVTRNGCAVGRGERDLRLSSQWIRNAVDWAGYLRSRLAVGNPQGVSSSKRIFALACC